MLKTLGVIQLCGTSSTSTAVIRRCIFRHNSSTNAHGSAIWAGMYSNGANDENCLFYEHTNGTNGVVLHQQEMIRILTTVRLLIIQVEVMM